MTLWVGAFYIARMQTRPERRRPLDDLEHFSATIEELIALCRRLREENSRLRRQCQTLSGEKGQLLEINERSRAQLEATIARLKDLEEEL